MTRALLGLGLVAAVAPSPAIAENNRDLVTRPLVLARGQMAASLTLEVNLDERTQVDPISVAPDAWYGVTPRWTIGVIHSSATVARIDAGASFCFEDSASACPALYRGGGIDVRWSWRDGPLAIAPRGRLLLRDVDPMKPAFTLGAIARWTRGRFGIVADPYVMFGLGNRESGNREIAVVPVWLGVQPTCRWLVALHTGIDGELATWRDGWHVPFGLVVTARATTSIDVAVEAGFPQLLGPQNDFKQRAIAVTVAIR